MEKKLEARQLKPVNLASLKLALWYSLFKSIGI